MTPQREGKIKRVLNTRQPDLTVVLENVHDPHNISAVMRTCDAVGIQEIYILNTAIGLHEKFGKRSSASAANWLSVIQYQDTAECMNVVKNKYRNIYATHLGVDSVSLYDLDLAGPMALVFGNEHEGVTDECLRYCDGNFIIPQVGMVQSLNISVACAVSLYEAYRQKMLVGHYNGIARLPASDVETLSQRWGLIDPK